MVTWASTVSSLVLGSLNSFTAPHMELAMWVVIPVSRFADRKLRLREGKSFTQDHTGSRWGISKRCVCDARVKGNKRRGQNTHGWSTVQVHHHFSQKKGGEVVPRSYWKRTPPQPKPWLQTANQSAAWWEKNKILTLCPLVSCPSSQKQQKQKDRELWVTGFTYISETEQMKTNQYWDFSGGPEVKTLSFQCSGFGFEPWFGN